MFGPLFDAVPDAAPVPPEHPGHKAPLAIPPPLAPDFQGIEFLVGGTWNASSPGGITYQETVVKTLEGWFLTSSVVTTKPGGQVFTTGMMGVDASNQFLLMWAFQSTGSVVQLKQVKPPTADPPGGPRSSWFFEGISKGQQVRQTVTQTGPDGMQTVTEVYSQGKWQASPPLPYERTA
jgi:hypothetical protein